MTEPNENEPKTGHQASDDVVFAEPEVAPPESVPVAKEADPLETAKADATRFRDQLLRTAADFDNFRKRARRENEDATRKGTERAIKELLPVFDNLERASQSADTAPDVKSVADGLRMVGRQFTGALEKLGIRRVESIGKPFDPSQHEAISHIESSEYAAGIVAAEVQGGYLIGDYLLRAALVVVSKGAPADAAQSVAEGSKDGSTAEGSADPNGSAEA